MKNMKNGRAFTVAIIVALLLPMFSPITTHAADTVTVQQIQEYAYDVNGKTVSGYGGLCLKYVFKVLKDLGAKAAKIGKSCGCAKEAADYLIESTSRENIPVGALVFWDGSKKQKSKCSKCGQYPGHVGIYVGENKVLTMHANGVAKITTLEYWDRAGYKYLGYGFAKNVDIVDVDVPTDYIDISLTNTVADQHKEGSFASIRGEISSYTGLIEVYAQIIDEFGNVVQEQHDYLDHVTSVSVRPLNINQKLLFDKLEGGKRYTLRIVAISETLCNEYNKNFEVIGVKPTITFDVGYIGTIKMRKCKNLTGTVKTDMAGDVITELYACIKDLNGNVLFQSFDYGNKSSINLKASNANYQAAAFNKLSKGNYYFVLTAKSSMGGYAEYATMFTIN